MTCSLAPPAPVFLSHGEDEVRVLLRGLLAAMLRPDGALYSPVYVGPLPRPDAAEHAITEACMDLGIADADEAGVVLARVGAADARLPAVAPLLVLWGSEPVDRLSAAVRGAIGGGGVTLDPRANGRASLVTRPALATALRGAAARPDAFPLLLVASDSDAVVAAGEVQLRLEALGFGPVRVADAAALAGRPIPPPSAARGRTPALVARLPDAADSACESARLLAARARADGTALVLLASPSVAAALVAEQEVASPGRWPAVCLEPAATAAHGAPAAWPPLHEVLPGGPPPSGPQQPLAEFPLSTRPLYEVLQLADVWREEGFLLVYAPDRLAWIATSGDHLTAVRRLGDDPAHGGTSAMRLVREIATWQEARAVLLRRGPGSASEVRIPMAMAALELRCALDEAEAGSAASSPTPRPRPLTPHRVGEELAAWGLREHAIALLRDVEHVGSLGVEEEVLLAHLRAADDPDEAITRLQRAVVRLVGEGGSRWPLQVDATLCALLLEVRTGRTHAPAAWGVVTRWLETAGDGWVRTARHAAAIGELALRAGEPAPPAVRERMDALSAAGDRLPELLDASGH